MEGARGRAGERTVLKADKKQQIAYFVAVQAVAERVAARLDERRVHPEDYLEQALAEVRRVEAQESSEYLWIFRDPITLSVSAHVFEALDEAPDGTRDWLQADTASAVAAVARFDVIAAVSEMSCDPGDADVEDGGDGLPARGVGRA